jgi:UDP-N-acetylglucosamine--N-acetylmuramyl-(pentapeptide) pyrophosphoryl-undecaprenol N-acetylglucosamine transferase
MSLVNKSAAILIEDNQTDSILRTAMDLLKDENQLNTISQNAKKMGKPNASEDIVNEIFKLIS